MHVSSPTEARQGLFAAFVALPLTLLAASGTVLFAGFIV